MARFKEQEVLMLLKTSPDPQTSAFANHSEVVKSLTEVFNATLDLAESSAKGGGGLAFGLALKTNAIVGVSATASQSTALRSANFMGTQMLKTIGLVKLANMTPAKASIYLTLTMAEKVVSAAGFANVGKCKVAVASLSATVGMGAFTCFASGAFTMGIGCVAGAIAVAAEAFDTYGQCYGPQSR